MRLRLFQSFSLFSALAFVFIGCDSTDSKFSTVSSQEARQKAESADALGEESDESIDESVEVVPTEENLGQQGESETKVDEPQQVMDPEVEIPLEVTDKTYVVVAEKQVAAEPERVHDFLFILDNSISMDAVLDKMNAGFEKLSKSAFPEGSKIAFMTSNAARGNNIHPEFNEYKGIIFEPGFLKPVNGQDIASFVKNSLVDASVRNKFKIHEGCDGWFEPSALTLGGTNCFAAHSQLSLTPTYVEPLSYAFMQYMERQGANAFRPNADAHVIFVTDTQFVGVHKAAGEDLWEKSPKTYNDIKEGLTASNIGVESLTLHAIAPITEIQKTCSEPWISNNYTIDGKPYYNVIAEESGGISIDVCSATNYETILSKIAVSAEKKKVEITLPQSDLTKADLRVKVNGDDYETFTLNGSVVTVWVDAKMAHSIVVEASK